MDLQGDQWHPNMKGSAQALGPSLTHNGRFVYTHIHRKRVLITSMLVHVGRRDKKPRCEASPLPEAEQQIERESPC
jgi:hypothetical protein